MAFIVAYGFVKCVYIKADKALMEELQSDDLLRFIRTGADMLCTP